MYISVEPERSAGLFFLIRYYVTWNLTCIVIHTTGRARRKTRQQNTDFELFIVRPRSILNTTGASTGNLIKIFRARSRFRLSIVSGLFRAVLFYGVSNFKYWRQCSNVPIPFSTSRMDFSQFRFQLDSSIVIYFDRGSADDFDFWRVQVLRA